MTASPKRSQESQTALLWQRLRQRHCQESRQALITRYAYLVNATVSRLGPGLAVCVQRADLQGEGMLGLIKAVDRFDPDRGVKFTSFAITLIRGAMLESLRADDWTPRRVHALHKEITRAAQAFETTQDHKPSEEELAQQLGWNEERLAKANRDIAQGTLVSLDATSSAGSSGEPLFLHDILPSQDDPLWVQMARHDRDAQIHALLARLKPRERAVVTRYYYQSQTFQEISAALGVSESRAYQLHTQAIQRLRKWLLARGEEVSWRL